MTDIINGWQTGIVAVIDFLGTRSLTVENTEVFLENLMKFSDKLSSDFDSIDAYKGKHQAAIEIFKKYDQKIYMQFGDTVIICWGVNGQMDEVPSELYRQIGLRLNRNFKFCLQHKLLIRGAISSGLYYETSEKSIIVTTLSSTLPFHK